MQVDYQIFPAKDTVPLIGLNKRYNAVIKQKEVTPMKTITYHTADFTKRPNVPYPNAATRRQILDRIVELLLMAGMGMGAAAMLLFIFALA